MVEKGRVPSSSIYITPEPDSLPASGSGSGSASASGYVELLNLLSENLLSPSELLHFPLSLSGGTPEGKTLRVTQIQRGVY